MIDVEKRKEFGEWLRSVRKRKDLSLNGAARRLGYATKGTLIGIECGQASIPVEKVHPIAELYGIDLQVLLDKLKECEPDLYEKFVSLERNFFQDFTRRLETLRTSTGGRSSSIVRGPDGEQVLRHHLPYPALPDLVDSLYIIGSTGQETLIPPEYYQMTQLPLDFGAQAEKVIPLFPKLETETEDYSHAASRNRHIGK
jgi:transcriptional regulator with XRE-family HTH domain